MGDIPEGAQPSLQNWDPGPLGRESVPRSLGATWGGDTPGLVWVEVTRHTVLSWALGARALPNMNFIPIEKA